jgi:hypothetical protein
MSEYFAWNVIISLITKHSFPCKTAPIFKKKKETKNWKTYSSIVYRQFGGKEIGEIDIVVDPCFRLDGYEPSLQHKNRLPIFCSFIVIWMI